MTLKLRHPVETNRLETGPPAKKARLAGLEDPVHVYSPLAVEATPSPNTDSKSVLCIEHSPNMDSKSVLSIEHSPNTDSNSCVQCTMIRRIQCMCTLHPLWRLHPVRKSFCECHIVLNFEKNSEPPRTFNLAFYIFKT